MWESVNLVIFGLGFCAGVLFGAWFMCLALDDE
jgi:hypothetical protein